MKRDSVNDACFQCHAEKRGPFVHIHEPVSEDCGNCHNPHGTVVESMLKVRAPFLCHECHTPHGGFIPQLIGSQVTGLAPTTPNGLGKGATNLAKGAQLHELPYASARKQQSERNQPNPAIHVALRQGHPKWNPPNRISSFVNPSSPSPCSRPLARLRLK